MAIKYVNSAASGANNGTSKTDAWTSLASAVGVAAGDDVWLSHTHSETIGAAATWTFTNGAAANPIKLASVNFATDVYTPGAKISTGGGASARDLSIRGNIRLFGFVLEAERLINLTSSSLGFLLAEDCTYQWIVTSGSTSEGRFGLGDSTVPYRTRLSNCTFDWRNGTAAFSYIELARGLHQIHNCTFLWATSQADLVSGFAATAKTIVEFLDCDLSSAPATIAAWAGADADILFRNCNVPSSWLSSGPMSGTPSTPQFRVRQYSCGNGTLTLPTSGLSRDDGFLGSILNDSNHYRIGGSTDGFQPTPISWQMSTNANALEIYNSLESDTISRRLPAATSPSGATPKGLFHTTRCAPLATPAALTTDSSSTWIPGDATVAVKQKIEITLSNLQTLTIYVASAATLYNDDFWIECSEPDQVGGVVTVKFFLAKPSTTVYVDPRIYLA